MGLVGGVLLGPVKLLAWTAQQVLDVAERELHDEASIQDGLARLNHAFDAGEIDEAEFNAAEDVLIARLMAARRGDER